MILLFPDADTFRLVLTGGFVPPDVSLTEASVAFAPDGRLSVETNAKLTKKAAGELTRLGVSAVKRHVADAEPMSCWLQILPVDRDPNPPQLASQAPVLFELESAIDLPVIVNEMLRLGNDRQGLRWLGDIETEHRALLRVIGPPYYTLLRALDQTASNTKGTVRAYLESAPRVWVQVGTTHPLAAQMKLDEEQLVLLRPHRSWTYLPEAPFRDVYEALKLELPGARIDWSEAEVPHKLTVPLRLVPGNAADAPELWVLRTDAVRQLDDFVRDADDRDMRRLKFAVAKDKQGNELIVLRVMTSKLGPPPLQFTDAIGFKPYFKLPNLYIPAGTRLHPPLRRDAVRNLLADDTDQLVWLFPGDEGQFTPETLPEDSFRPLEDWVDYIIETNHAPLAAWVESTQFDFEHFICADPSSPKPPRDDDGKAKRRAKGGPDETQPDPNAPTPGAKKPTGAVKPPPTAMTLPPIEAKKPSDWEVLRAQLEERFKAIDGPLDHLERQALWPELAVANAGFGNLSEAALCWVNGLWERDTLPAEWIENWFRAELPDHTGPVTAAMFDSYLKQPAPSMTEVRHFVVLLLRGTQSAPIPEWLKARLPAVQRYLEDHERKLPVRAVWLAAAQLATLSGADTLGLARVRDRLLERLLEEGLHAERDIPRFLRNAGTSDSARVRLVQEKAHDLHRQVKAWLDASLKSPTTASQSDQNGTAAYTDLFFAFALAKLGETTHAQQLIKAAETTLRGYPTGEDRAIAGAFLLKALRYRIDQALEGKRHGGPFPPELLKEYDDLHREAERHGNTQHPSRWGDYAIARFREQSRILEPHERVNPYHNFMVSTDLLRKELAGLPGLQPASALVKRVRELLSTGLDERTKQEVRFMVLSAAIPLASRGGEAFTLELIEQVPDVLQYQGAANQPLWELSELQGKLLEQALFMAAHFDRREVVQQLVDQFVKLLQSKAVEQRYELVNVVATECLRSLRKLGLRDEIDKLLRRMQDVVLSGQSLTQLRNQYRGKTGAKPDVWAKVLRSLLNLAGGWLTFGLSDQARPILEQAREDLLGANSLVMSVQDYTVLAQAYVAALGNGPADDGLIRISELYRKIDPTRITNTFTSSRCYSRLHLNLIEETVRAIVSDDFALGQTGRRWLDEDEYLVRRRIHRDMRQHLQRSGL